MTRPADNDTSHPPDFSSLPCPACDAGPTATATDTAHDCRSFRDALGSFATGIAVVTTTTPEGEQLGLTINSFNSVSLDPPLVLWSLDLNSPNLAAFRNASHYTINILAADQIAVSQHFATRQPDKFSNTAHCPGDIGAPLLHGCCAWFECVNETQYPGGDHLIFLGRVARFTHDPLRPPLLYHSGRYRLLAQD